MDREAFERRQLVCPACRARLTLDRSGQSVGCTGCGRVFPVRDGIPVLLLTEAALPRGAGKK
jgi:hypothetical protein